MAKHTASEIRPASGGTKIVLAGVAISVALMLGAILMFRLSGPSMVKQGPGMPQARPSASQTMPPAMEGMEAPAGMEAMVAMMGGNSQNGMDPQAENAVVGAMQRLKANPNDLEALLELADQFTEQQNFGSAQGFINRAMVAAPADPRPPYYQGILHVREGKYKEAAEAMERSLRLLDNPATRYSLANIYLYYLEEQEKGLTMLRLGLESPNLPEGLRTMIMDELDKQAEAE